jgi:ElaB/YqjD/DUF883 family membrane-anchored ribosome-binding protein
MVEDLSSEEIISLEASEVRLNEEQRKILLNGLALWLQHPLDEQISLANQDNLYELIDVLVDLGRTNYKWLNDESISDLKIVHSLLSRLENRVMKAFRDIIQDAKEQIEKALRYHYQYPYGEIPEQYYYKYYPEGYPYYYEKPSKEEHYQKAMEKAIALAKEYDLKSKNLDSPSIWDYVSIDLATSKVGGRKLEDLMKEKPSESELIQSICKEIEEQIKEKKNQEYEQLSQKIQELEKDYQEKQKELESFRWKVINKWIELEKERME